jgi:hypothetical protein
MAAGADEAICFKVKSVNWQWSWSGPPASGVQCHSIPAV